MEIRVIEESKNSLVFEIAGVSHGFCNLLKEELSGDDSVKAVAYRIDHPLIGVPRIKVAGSDPRASVKKAVKRARKMAEEFEKEAKKLR
jgi:DNA-directed RNA polymerase subunit L